MLILLCSHLYKVIENWDVNSKPLTTQVKLSNLPVIIEPIEDEVSELGLLELLDSIDRCKISANEMIDLINKKLFDSDNL